MTALNSRERELVALGASLASNCVPCIEFHIREVRKANLTDAEIAAAIKLADKIKHVPAAKVLEVASGLLSVPIGGSIAASGTCCTSAADAKT